MFVINNHKTFSLRLTLFSTIKFDLDILISVCNQPSGDIQRVQNVDANDPTQSVRHKVDGLYNSVQVKVRFSLSWEITFKNKLLNNYFITISLFNSLFSKTFTLTLNRATNFIIAVLFVICQLVFKFNKFYYNLFTGKKSGTPHWKSFFER